MKKHNAENERIKHSYLAYLKEADGKSEASLDAVAKALSRFEEYTKQREFRTFRHEQAIAFKRHLTNQVSQQTSEPLSKATLYSTLNALRNFFLWLAREPGFKSRLKYSDAEYFKLSEKETRIATAHRERPVPTLEQIAHVIERMPSGSEIERRNRAIIAFTILTGARDGAMASLKLKHINIIESVIEQDPREVKTKASKTITTWFFPVPESIRQIVVDWVDFLLKEKRWGFDDPLFPATQVGHGTNRQFAATGIDRKPWLSAAPIREIFKEAFAQAGLRYYNPHSFRKTLMQLAFDRKLSHEELKAWSQNLGHEQLMTSLASYATVPRNRQAEIMRELRNPRKPTAPADNLLGQMAELIEKARAERA